MYRHQAPLQPDPNQVQQLIYLISLLLTTRSSHPFSAGRIEYVVVGLA